MTEVRWTAKSGWDSILPVATFGRDGQPGVTVQPRNGLEMLSLLTSTEQKPALAKLVKKHCGLSLPQAGRAEAKGDFALLWTAPFQYLLMREAGSSLDPATFANGAAVSDQSDGRLVLRVSGPDVKKTLAKGCMIDLAEAAFPVGAVASTAIAHMGVQIWRVDGAQFDLIVARSSAGSFWSWFQASAAEFGGRMI